MPMGASPTATRANEPSLEKSFIARQLNGSASGSRAHHGSFGPAMTFDAGYRQNAMPPAVGTPGVTVCFSCGVVGPLGPVCDACEEQTGAIPARFEGDVVWCAVKASFQCRSCGFPSPLDGVIVSNGIECAQCGSFQQFDASVWSEALPFVHEVGDLGGPSPEGRFPNPSIWIGDENP